MLNDRYVGGHEVRTAARHGVIEGGRKRDVVAGGEAAVAQEDAVPLLAGEVVCIPKEDTSFSARVHLGRRVRVPDVGGELEYKCVSTTTQS